MVRIENRENLLEDVSSPLTRRAREIALDSIERALNAADPRTLLKARTALKNDLLAINGKKFDLSNFGRIFVIGGGKASGSMAESLEEILGDRIDRGIVVVPRGTSSQHKVKKITLHEASHPIPGEDSVEGAKKITDMTSQVGETDLVICLISGGGSSLMTMPRQNVSLEDKKMVTSLLLRSGANINEINTVRKHISEFKGGMLAKRAYPATLISLLLSDVIGDDLDVIASGPTVPDSSTFQDASDILERYGLWRKIPDSVRTILSDGVRGFVPETPKSGDGVFQRVHNIILGNNRLASMAAVEELRRQGMNTVFLTSFAEGEARGVGVMLAALAREISISGNPVPKPAAIVMGGETTVTVTGSGKGGRNQEVTLSASIKVEDMDGTVIVSASTDGVDGPTDAAGAIADGHTVDRARRKGMNHRKYLEDNDSYSFFSQLHDLIFTGPTGTNVNDLSILVMI